MREYEEEDPKKPQPVWIAKKRSNSSELSEAVPCRKGDDRDHHRHVV
jgi:hypothetical protein